MTDPLRARFATMIVCVCRRISDRDIQRAAREGVASFEALQSRCGIGTACGSCLDSARDTWAAACLRGGAPTAASQRPVEAWAAPA